MYQIVPLSVAVGLEGNQELVYEDDDLAYLHEPHPRRLFDGTVNEEVEKDEGGTNHLFISCLNSAQINSAYNFVFSGDDGLEFEFHDGEIRRLKGLWCLYEDIDSYSMIFIKLKGTLFDGLGIDLFIHLMTIIFTLINK